ncbi:MAG: hypothetical protein ACI8PZ_002090 [Myxococcota bacterium]|jgi:DNA-binding Xre family transcriptional regulator
MSRPSDPLLRWLREMLDKREMNVAALSQRCGIPRPRLRRVLSGGDPMQVDELLTISQALELDPSELGLAAPGELEVEGAATSLSVAPSGNAALKAPPEEPTGVTVDPWGNHARQLLEVAFGLGCDFFFFSEVDLLADSGVPEAVLSKYKGSRLPLKLDGAYHSYNRPRYTDTDVTLDLSFDAVYTCKFPWNAIKQVVFYPPPPSETMGDDGGDDTTEPEPPKRSHLRLVT